VAAAADHPSLLPEAFRTALGQALPQGRPVRLGSRVEALRYDDLVLPEPERRRMRMFVAPTDAGVATVVCLALPAEQCDRAAASLKLDGLRPLSVGPDPAYAGGPHPRAQVLRTAGRPPARTAAIGEDAGRTGPVAGRLAETYATAASAVRALRAPPVVQTEHERLRSGLDAAAAAYRRLRRAAAAGDRRRTRARRGRRRPRPTQGARSGRGASPKPDTACVDAPESARDACGHVQRLVGPVVLAAVPSPWPTASDARAQETEAAAVTGARPVAFEVGRPGVAALPEPRAIPTLRSKAQAEAEAQAGRVRIERGRGSGARALSRSGAVPWPGALA
jgi:hypothetical protein